MDQSSETPIQKNLRTYWKDEILTKTFLEASILEGTVSGRQGSSLKPYSWENVGEILRKTHSFDVDQSQVINRYDYLRHRYAAWCSLKTKTEENDEMEEESEDESQRTSQGTQFMNSLRDQIALKLSPSS
ncbi:hypothetical protein POM88_008437 [Heracleum sosnowskyi]|uniref:Myb/SANT-like domain-containing protein n=1 Tax=Heracleum sosnowskyi TaxID=360622 RepID=A0AAD8J6N3_9APIA|nr:hypothetical protein POM88_008437 [Heracleum sosnowskyi]